VDYKESGVDIDKANQATQSIKKSVRATWGKEVLSDVGSFGGLYAFPQNMNKPILVSSMDGVGTKLLVASMAERFGTVGQDRVNHCVNDILVQGARPLYFLDYVAAGSLRPEMVSDLVGGLALACGENQCALIGGETAEMPGLYQGEDFDLAGTVVGVVEMDQLIDGKRIAPGDIVYALPSSGLHTNGYSLARHVLFDKLGLTASDHVDAFGCSVADELLKVHRSYLAEITELRLELDIKGLAHITGGGVVENLPRILPDGCGARIDVESWEVPPVFAYMQEQADIDAQEMYRVFNMGLGMLIVVSPETTGEMPIAVGRYNLARVGEITSGSGATLAS